MPDSLESLCDLVEKRAAQHRTPLARLWERVFAALRHGDLDFDFPDEFKSEYGGPPHYVNCTRENHVNFIRETLCTSALLAIENGDAFDPWKQGWVQRMLVSAAAFDKALFPAHQKQHPGPEPLIGMLVDFMKKEFPGGVPRGMTRKRIAELAKGVVGKTVSEKTVARAKKLL